MKYIVYIAFNTETKMSYVGQTMRKLEDRIRSHYGCTYGRKFNRALRSSSESIWTWKTLEEVGTSEEAHELECFYIAKFKCFTNGYNSPAGSAKSDEARAKIALKNKGKAPWNKGKTSVYTDDARTRMALAKMGRTPVRTPEWRENIKTANQKALGRKVLNIETKEIYPSVTEAARQLGLAHSTVKRILNGKIKNSLYRIKYK